MTCAFGPCVPATCPLVGGCIVVRFGPQQRRVTTSEPQAIAVPMGPAPDLYPELYGGAPKLSALEADGLRSNARALAGTQPRPSRDPRFTPRKRKALTR